MSSILVVSAIHYQDADGSSFPEAECVKIDIEFVRDLASNTANQHLVKATVNIAQGFGVQTIAERVEDAATLELLRVYGVDLAQGFHIGRPAPVSGDVGQPPPVKVARPTTAGAASR
jgi:EAL domain-containing protein (putative c-di-GMP-specific phosphodiesterase class I)